MRAPNPVKRKEMSQGPELFLPTCSIHGCLKERLQEDGACGVLTGKGKKPASPGNASPKCRHFTVPLWTHLRDRQIVLLQVLSLEDGYSLLKHLNALSPLFA